MAWTDGLDEATLGHASLHNWKADGNPEEIARAAVQAHLQAQNILKAPAGEFVRSTDMDAIYKALGAAADPKEYVFDAVKFKDGTPIDEGLVGALRDTAARLRLSPAAAAELAADVVRWADEAETETSGEAAAKRSSEDIELRRAWGGNYEAFKGDAERAAALVGLTPADVEAFVNIKGYAATYEMLRGLSVRTGEAKFLTGMGAENRFKPMSREEAEAALQQFMNDPEKVKSFHTKESQDYLNHLHRIRVGMPA